MQLLILNKHALLSNYDIDKHEEIVHFKTSLNTQLKRT